MFRGSAKDWQSKSSKGNPKGLSKSGSSKPKPTRNFTQVQQWFAILSNEDTPRALKDSETFKADTKYDIEDTGFKGNFKWTLTEKEGIKFRLKVHDESTRAAVATVTMPFDQSGFSTSYQKNPAFKGVEANDPNHHPQDHRHRFRVSQKSGENEFNTLDIRGPVKENSSIRLVGGGGERKASYKGMKFFLSDEITLGKGLRIHVKTEEA